MKGLAALALAFLAFMAIAANRTQLMLYQGFAYTLIAFAAAAILLVVLVWPPRPALLVLKFYPLVWVGRISYGLYLWHLAGSLVYLPAENLTHFDGPAVGGGVSLVCSDCPHILFCRETFPAMETSV